MTKKLAIECINTQRQFVDDMTKEAFDMAVEVLKRQKIGTWKPQGKQLDGVYVLWSCSVCGTVIYSEHEQNRTTFHKYCGMCGAKMEDENEGSN